MSATHDDHTRVYTSHDREWLEMPLTQTGTGQIKVIHVDEERKVAVFAARFGPGCKLFPHTHNAQIVAYTVKGEWEYEGLRLPEGAIAYESPGTEHTPYSADGAEVLIVAMGSDSDEYIINHMPDGSKLVFDSATLKQLIGMTQEGMAELVAGMTGQAL